MVTLVDGGSHLSPSVALNLQRKAFDNAVGLMGF